MDEATKRVRRADNNGSTRRVALGLWGGQAFGHRGPLPRVTLLRERMEHPLHQGPVDGATGRGSVGNPACGDVVTVEIRVDGERIEAAGFQSIGSPYQLAVASVLCDCIIGGTVAQARQRSPECMLERLPDLPARKRYLARLSLEAMLRAIDGAPDETEDDAMGEGEATSLVFATLQEGGRWSTMQIHDRAGGRPWPMPLAKFLAGLRKEGLIEGEMDGSAWCWWHPAPIQHRR